MNYRENIIIMRLNTKACFMREFINREIDEKIWDIYYNDYIVI